MDNKNEVAPNQKFHDAILLKRIWSQFPDRIVVKFFARLQIRRNDNPFRTVISRHLLSVFAIARLTEVKEALLPSSDICTGRRAARVQNDRNFDAMVRPSTSHCGFVDEVSGR